MKTPLARNPIFWTTVGINVLAADAVLVAFALSLFKQTSASALFPGHPVQPVGLQSVSGQPARDVNLGGFRPPPATLVNGKPPYAWQVERYEQGLLENSVPQVKILPTAYSGTSWSMSNPRSGMAIGVGVAPQMIILAAYQWQTNASRVLWPMETPGGQYDFIANLPTGGMEALQEEARKVLGLTATRETVSTNVLILKVNHADAPGLKPGSALARGTPPAPADPAPAGMTTLHNFPINMLARQLESRLRQPVIDQTGLTDRYDITYPRQTQTGGLGQSDTSEDQFKKALLDQTGLELTPATAPVEFLVVHKVPKRQ